MHAAAALAHTHARAHARAHARPTHFPSPLPRPQDDGDIPEETERRILETLLRIRRKDPAIYDPSVAFFPEADGADGGAGPQGEGEAQEDGGPDGKKHKRKEKKVFLKDVLARQALEQGGEPSSSGGEEEEGGGGGRGLRAPGAARKAKAYDTEQEALRRSFLEAAQVRRRALRVLRAPRGRRVCGARCVCCEGGRRGTGAAWAPGAACLAAPLPWA